MAKIMLVEDDNNLREIYEARLQAEGYEIVSAHDGEEALALAVKEKPDLIISDVMMPKISGFDMLDILRTTPETKDTKVIMMTALSQAEDKSRADRLGADRYLVKSQVTLEDVAKIAKEVLEGTSSTAPASPVPAAAPAPTNDPVAQPSDSQTTTVTDMTPAPAPAADPAPVAADDNASVSQPAADNQTSSPTTVTTDDSAVAATAAAVTQAVPAADELADVEAQVENFAVNSEAKTSPAKPEETEVKAEKVEVKAVGGERVIQPLGSPTIKPDINKLAAEEEAKNAGASSVIAPSTDQNPNDPNLIAL